MAGLPGTGKTTLAHGLASRTGGRVIGKDEIRHSLFLRDEIEYSSRQDDFCLQIMLESAQYLLRRNPQQIIFLDGRPFSKRYQIDNALSAASSFHQPWRILECVCSEETAKKRLEKQTSGNHPAANRNYELYLKVRSYFESITLPKTVINTEDSLEKCVAHALAVLR
jgi:predicted kinase